MPLFIVFKMKIEESPLSFYGQNICSSIILLLTSVRPPSNRLTHFLPPGTFSHLTLVRISIMLQVILIEIYALFGQLSQSMTTDCLLDYPTFYKHLSKLCSKFMNCIRLVNLHKFMDNWRTLAFQFLA